MTQSSFIKINPADTVVVCLRPFKQGETIDVDGHTVTVKQDVPAGHKVLIVDTPQGKDIIKYGYPIVVGSFVRVAPFKYRLVGGAPLVFGPDTDLAAATAELNVRLGEAIRLFPEQYLWAHRRWREK